MGVPVWTRKDVRQARQLTVCVVGSLLAFWLLRFFFRRASRFLFFRKRTPSCGDGCQCTPCQSVEMELKENCQAAHKILKRLKEASAGPIADQASSSNAPLSSADRERDVPLPRAVRLPSIEEVEEEEQLALPPPRQQAQVFHVGLGGASEDRNPEREQMPPIPVSSSLQTQPPAQPPASSSAHILPPMQQPSASSSVCAPPPAPEPSASPSEPVPPPPPQAQAGVSTPELELELGVHEEGQPGRDREGAQKKKKRLEEKRRKLEQLTSAIREAADRTKESEEENKTSIVEIMFELEMSLIQSHLRLLQHHQATERMKKSRSRKDRGVLQSFLLTGEDFEDAKMDLKFSLGASFIKLEEREHLCGVVQQRRSWEEVEDWVRKVMHCALDGVGEEAVAHHLVKYYNPKKFWGID
mmetsp:Transcript_38858/g.76396  ORF Transcript_38858/g.76396 Transcript_38858/m.76396 type:complete len:413 (+) Transcript_38858:345-1583(+)